MMPCTASSSSRASRLTRSGGMSVAALLSVRNRSVAEAPVAAAVAFSSVLVMAVSLRWVPWGCGSVGAVVRELVLVDHGAEAGGFADPEHPVPDLQRLGQQVVAHVEEVRQLPGPAGGGLERGPEGQAAQRAELAIDLVAHHHVDAKALTLGQDAVRPGEAGAGGLDADPGGRAAQQFPGDVSRGRDTFISK